MARFLVERTRLLREVDCVLAVPPNAARFAERGFSLPLDLARGLQAFLGVPCLDRAVVSSSKDVEMRGLGRTERRQAIRGAFSIGSYDPSRFSRVLVVDDVVTSGATLTEMARVLRMSGAESVYGLALAHTEG
jgi:predicted amidophosphoribosyltransferase